MKIQITDNNSKSFRHYSKSEVKELKNIISNNGKYSRERSRLLEIFCLKHSRNLTAVANKVQRLQDGINNTYKTTIPKTNNHLVVTQTNNREIKFPIKSISIENNNIIIKY
mgnify:CR=1 FL=1